MHSYIKCHTIDLFFQRSALISSPFPDVKTTLRVFFKNCSSLKHERKKEAAHRIVCIGVKIYFKYSSQIVLTLI